MPNNEWEQFERVEAFALNRIALGRELVQSGEHFLYILSLCAPDHINIEQRWGRVPERPSAP